MTDNEQLNARRHEADLWEFEERQRTSLRYQQIFQLYVLFGALLGAGTLAYFLFRQVQFNLSSEDRFLLLTSGTGFAVSIASAIYLFLRKQSSETKFRNVRYITSASDFLLQWSRFEEAAKKRLQATGRKFNRTSIREIIAGLLDTGVLEPADLGFVEEALRFRNFMVHSGSSVDLESLHHMTEGVRALVNRVETESIQ